MIFVINENINFDEKIKLKTLFQNLKNGPVFEFSGANTYILANLDFSRLYEDASELRILVGYANIEPTVEMDEKKFLELAEGSFLFLVYNKLNDSIRISTDSFGTIAFFYAHKKNKMMLSTHFELFFELNPENFELDYTVVAQFVEDGFVKGRDTLVKDLNYASPKTTISISKNLMEIESYSKKNKSYLVSPLDISEVSVIFHELTKEILKDQFNFYMYSFVLLTGGSDTRFILGSLDKSLLTSLRFITYKNVFWSADNADSEIATLVAKKFSLNHEVLAYPKDNTNSFKEYNKRVFPSHIMTGTFGSELLGNVIFTVKPFKKFLEANTLNAPSLINSVKNSFFSSLYYRFGTINFCLPYMNGFKKKLTPFIDTRILNLLTQLAPLHLQNYSIYRWLFKNSLSEFGSIPFHSAINKYEADFAPISNIESSYQFDFRKQELLLFKENLRKNSYLHELYEKNKKKFIEDELELVSRISMVSRWVQDFIPTELN